ncbi:Protein yippee-like [Colletotrichum sidae]|uniref:Protein yippee-like n=1 Tax=Colletotrichum sidae TaxID=1347389 RepID=A0A4V3I3F8_9PEZI|nr:Protein yippee-like [Colletotrichum sidae]
MAPNIIVSRPIFPTYLLPSLNLPFRRRRSSSSSSPQTPPESQVPSLSSSPTSSTTAETQSESPTTPPASPHLSQQQQPPPPPHSSPLPKPHLRRRRHPSALTRTQPDTLRCSTCSADIALASQIVSKGFTGRYGRAYLVAATSLPPTSPTLVYANSSAGPGVLANVRVGRCENRQLVTGWHVVADITCLLCSAKLGWKYVDAKELSQKYKVGKFILEVERVVPFRSWEDGADGEEFGVDVSDGEAQRDEVQDGEQEEQPIADDAGDGTVEEQGDEESGKKTAAYQEPEVVFDSEDEDDLEDLFSGTWDPEVVARRRSRKVSSARKK